MIMICVMKVQIIRQTDRWIEEIQQQENKKQYFTKEKMIKIKIRRKEKDNNKDNLYYIIEYIIII